MRLWEALRRCQDVVAETEAGHVPDWTSYGWQLVTPAARLDWTRVHGVYCTCAHTHPFNGPSSGTTRVSRHRKVKTNLDFTEARDSEWQ